MNNVINIEVKNVYDGPMDLLLNLIKENKIDIYDIPISYLTNEFSNRLGLITYKNLDVFLDFSIMASTLLQIKSKTLLPVENDEVDEDDPRKELVDRIIEYNYFKYISNILVSSYNVGSKKLFKNTEDLTILSFEKEIDYKKMDINKLSKTYKKFQKKKPYKDIDAYEIEENDYTFEESMEKLFDILNNNKSFTFNLLLGENSSRIEIVTHFLVILELVKESKLKLSATEKDVILAYE